MNLSDFPIGSICKFAFSGWNFNVEVVGKYGNLPGCVYVAPEDSMKREGLGYQTTINGRYAFATSIGHLQLLELPMEDNDAEPDIRTLI